MADLYTAEALDALRDLLNVSGKEAADILDAVAPLIAAKALRDAAEEHTTLIPDVLGYKVQAVFTEDLLEAAAEAERGFGK